MRCFIFSDRAWSYEKMKSVRHVGKSGLLQASKYQDVLWELRPNLDTSYKFYPFRTNSRGLRDLEYSLDKPANTFRVAVLGDSFTMPEGVPIEEAYHTLLEERFNALNNGEKYEFINFAVAGYSLIQYVTTIRRKVLEYKPDVILIGFCAANDSKLPNMDNFNRPYKVKSEANGFFHFYSLELLGNIYKTYYKKLRGRYSGYNADPQYVETQFAELSKISNENRIPIVIAYIDNKAASADLDLVRQSALRHGFEFIDGTVNFGAEISDQHIIYLTDKHPNGAANRILAETLYPALQKIEPFRIPLRAPY